MGALPKQNRLLDGIAPGSYFKRGSIRGKEDNGMEEEQRKTARRAEDRCPGCVIDKVVLMEDKMEKMAKAINRLVGAHGVVLLVFILAIGVMFKSSLTASDSALKIEAKYDSIATKQIEIDTTQDHVLSTQSLFRVEIKGLHETNKEISKYVGQMASDNREQTKYLKLLSQRDE